MITILIATRNRHKVGEIRRILGGRFRSLTLEDFPGAPPVIEDRATFAENAAKKSRELGEWLAREHALPPGGETLVLADDSGLEVDALGGAPGVHSARFAALDRSAVGPPAKSSENSPDADNNAKLLRLLNGVTPGQRTARFRCVIAVSRLPSGGATADLATELFEGACEGRIGFTPAGAGGFGYDPLFVPEGFSVTFAELGEDEKNRISHRARALARLREWLAQGGRCPG